MSRGNRSCRTCWTRMLRGCERLVRNKSRACRARGLWRTTRHTDKLAALYTAADRRPTNQVSAWQAERGSRSTRRHPRSILARMSRVSARMSRGCYEETASVEFQLMHTRHRDFVFSDARNAVLIHVRLNALLPHTVAGTICSTIEPLTHTHTHTHTRVCCMKNKRA